MPAGGEIFTLDQLAAATGTNLTPGGGPDSLFSAAGGGAAVAIDFEDFSIESINTPTTNSLSYGHGATITVTVPFGNPGPRFLSRIANRPQNFTWTAGTNMTIGTNSGYIHTFTNAYNPGGTNCNQSTTSNITVSFNDQGFNNHAVNYNTPLATSFVTLYSPPTPSVSYGGGIKPSTCSGVNNCLGNNVSCGGAQIILNGNAGSYQGSTGSTLDYYIANTFIAQRSGATSTLTSPAQYCTATTYTAYVINNFTCRSSTISFTSVAYI